jgi:hypothetical protein
MFARFEPHFVQHPNSRLAGGIKVNISPKSSAGNLITNN